MKTTQGLGWLAAGVVALGLNGFYHDGGLELAHRVADRISNRSQAVVALASDRANDLLAKVEMVSARGETQSCRLAGAAAHLQAQVDRTQARLVKLSNARTADGVARIDVMSARQEEQMARLEANRARIEAQAARFRFAAFNPVMVRVPKVSVVCPRMRVLVPQPNINISVPSIRISTGGTGPI